jgi:FAD synthetase
VLGYDQHHEEESVAAALEERGIDCRVERAGPRETAGEGELLSTGDIIQRVLEQRG